MTGRVEGKVAFVTGAARGQGRRMKPHLPPVLNIIALATFAASLSARALDPVLPHIAEDFGVSIATAAGFAAVFAFYAAKLGVNYESFEAVARTNFDVRGHMMPDAPPSGFQRVTIAINVKSDASPETLREVERLALQGCPGIATLRDPVAVESPLTVTASAENAAAVA